MLRYELNRDFLSAIALTLWRQCVRTGWTPQHTPAVAPDKTFVILDPVVYADDEVAVSANEIRHRELPIVLLGMAGFGRQRRFFAVTNARLRATAVER